MSSALANLPIDCLSTISSFVSTYATTAASIPNSDLMQRLKAINDTIIAERIAIGMDRFKRAYAYQNFYRMSASTADFGFGSTWLRDAQDMLRVLLGTHDMTIEKLYDMLWSYEMLKVVGFPSSFSLFELRNYLFKRIAEDHRGCMRRVFVAIEARRVEATHCSGGCKKCDADLPVWWPSAKTHRREERSYWFGETMGFYRIGFCSGNCITEFNNDIRMPSSRIEEPDNGVMSRHTQYTCEHRYCKAKIHWTDLEYRGSGVFCSDACENHEYEEKYEDDQMYAKYDRMLDRY
jgi:hypothetical protein